MFDIALPLFVVRHRLIGGTESSLYNICRGLEASGASLTIAKSSITRFSSEFDRWLTQAHVAQESWPSFGASGAARFIAESWYVHRNRTASNILLPNYFLPRMRHSSSYYAVQTYDLQFKTYPEYFSAKKRAWLHINHIYSFRNADSLMFISEFERDQAAKHYGDSLLNRSHVIYTPVDWSRYERMDPSAETAILAARRFILAVAHPFPHKNLHKLAAAYSQIASIDKDIHLVLVGQKSPDTQRMVRAAVNEAFLPRVFMTGFLPDADVGALYKAAQVVAVPSLYEGFGMPAVEALGFGRPVLASDGGALREVTLGRARYLPTSASVADWSAALADILRNDGGGWQEASAAVRTRYDPVTIAGLIERGFAGG